MKKIGILSLLFLCSCTSPITDVIVAIAELPVKIPMAIVSGSIKLAKQAFGSSKDEGLHMKNIVGKVFELQHDLFLYADANGYFLRNDNEPVAANHGKAHIKGLIKKGTSFRVTEISRKSDSFYVLAELNSSEWKGMSVNIGDFFKMVNDLTFEPFNYYLKEEK